MATPLGRVLRGMLVIGLALGLFGCDEATKNAARSALGHGGSVPVVGSALELRYVENTDIAFNAFHRLGLAHSPALLAMLGGVAVVLVVGAAFAARQWMPRVALALIVGGALGNVVDRVSRGYVVDFIHLRGWPVFNVADIAVCVGMGLLVLARLRSRRTEAGNLPAA